MTLEIQSLYLSQNQVFNESFQLGQGRLLKGKDRSEERCDALKAEKAFYRDKMEYKNANVSSVTTQTV